MEIGVFIDRESGNIDITFLLRFNVEMKSNVSMRYHHILTRRDPYGLNGLCLQGMGITKDQLLK